MWLFFFWERERKEVITCLIFLSLANLKVQSCFIGKTLKEEQEAGNCEPRTQAELRGCHRAWGLRYRERAEGKPPPGDTSASCLSFSYSQFILFVLSSFRALPDLLPDLLLSLFSAVCHFASFPNELYKIWLTLQDNQVNLEFSKHTLHTYGF